MARLLITGSSGLLGLNLALEAISTHQVTGLDRGRLAGTPFRLIKGDLLVPHSIRKILESAQPECLINCAAMTDLDACEENPELARLLNSELPGELADECRRCDIRFLHISTDAVFDGEKMGSYTEEDLPNPPGVYAQTKLAGENALRQINPEAIVARVNIYGWSLSGRRSLAEFFFNNLTHNKSMSGFTDVIFCPMQVNQLARLLLVMLEKKFNGVYHVVGPQAMNKYMFGLQIARKFGFDESYISPKSILSSGLSTPRSQNLSLSTHKLSTALDQPLPEFSTGLEEFYAQFLRGYPQNIRSYQQVSTRVV